MKKSKPSRKIKEWRAQDPCLFCVLIVPQLFFEGVQAKVGQGVKESEIGYQMAFSKQELRKVIALYPTREVKRGQESVYKSNLRQVPFP